MLAATAILLAGVIDWRHRRIPNSLVLALLVLSTASAIGTDRLDFIAITINVTLGLLLTIPGYAKGLVGGGDIKLMVAISPLWPTLQFLSIFAIGVIVSAIAMYVEQAIYRTRRLYSQATLQATSRSLAIERGLPLGTAIAAGMCIYEIGNFL